MKQLKYKGIFWGIVLIAIGAMIILRNMDIVHFNLFAILQLWPLLLVIWGISLIPIKEYIKFILSIVVLIIGLFLVNYYSCNDSFCWNWKYSDDKVNWHEQTMEEDYDSTTTQAILKLEAVAGEFTIADITNKLITLESKGSISYHILNTTNDDSIKTVEINVEEKVVRFGSHHKGNSTKIALNPNPIWDLELEAGASNVNFDLANFKVRSIDFDGGASDVMLKIGNKQPIVNIKIEAGASSIKVYIPKDASCELDGDNVLMSKELNGFVKSTDDKYRTPDFDKNPNKIYINLDAAVSSISVERY